MREEVFLGGIGGQGVLLAGQMLARAGMDLGLNVSWFPIYSPEVRGGYTTCTVVLTDGGVGSPLSERPPSMIMMDPISMRSFGHRCADDGLMVLNGSLIAPEMVPDGVRVLWVPASDIALEIGNERTVNMVMVGAWAQRTGVFTIEQIAGSLRKMLPERHHKHMPTNEAALQRGAELGSAT